MPEGPLRVGPKGKFSAGAPVLERLVWLAGAEELGRHLGFLVERGNPPALPSPGGLRTWLWERMGDPAPLEEQSTPISAGGGFCGAAEPSVCQEPS